MKVKIRIIKSPHKNVPTKSLPVANAALTDTKQHYMPQHNSQLHVDYAGGYDHCLLELSDVLPASLYGTNTRKL